MDLYARVNILDGRAVRLPRGDVHDAIALHNDPLGRINNWFQQGADYVHVVDLDAAAFGDYKNRYLIDRILEEATGHVQIAGGMAVLAAVAWVQSRQPDHEAEAAPESSLAARFSPR